MSRRVVHTAEFPDGSEVMVEEWIDSTAGRVRMTAAIKPPRAAFGGVRTWGPPQPLEAEDVW